MLVVTLVYFNIFQCLCCSPECTWGIRKSVFFWTRDTPQIQLFVKVFACFPMFSLLRWLNLELQFWDVLDVHWMSSIFGQTMKKPEICRCKHLGPCTVAPGNKLVISKAPGAGFPTVLADKCLDWDLGAARDLLPDLELSSSRIQTISIHRIHVP